MWVQWVGAVVHMVSGVISMKSIDMYIHHDSSLVVCFSKRSRIYSVNVVRVKVKVVTVPVVFPHSPRGGGSVAISF